MSLKDWNLEAAEEYNEAIELCCTHDYAYDYYGFWYCSLCGHMITRDDLK
jgi:hypothetical protein